MKSSEPAEQGYLYALRLLAARDYGSLKLKEKLKVRYEAQSETIVGRLQAEGWINDRRFAERFAESAVSTGRFFGPRLKLEMRRRGIPAAIVDEVLQQIRNEHDEGDGLCSLLKSRFPGFCFKEASDKEKRRVIGFLQRRGFGLSAIMQTLKADFN